MAKKPAQPHSGLPTREAILAFIEDSKEPAGKREIARHFGIRGAEKIPLKALLKDMTDEGLLDLAPGRAFHKMGGLPKVTVLRIAAVEGSTPIAVPERWEAATPPPRIRVIERGRRGALGIGDRILARIESAGEGHVAHPMKVLEAGASQVMGVVVQETAPSGQPMLWLRPTDKRERRDWPLSDKGEAKVGDLVLAALAGRGVAIKARVTAVLGDPFQPRSLSLIAISKFGIPDVFGADTLAESELAAKLPVTDVGREDLRHLPIVAIDPVDARDFDDAVWAAPDDDPANAGGFRAIVAIADVSYYVRDGSAVDREARRRGNSVYFPDRVVPMLPETLSAGVCSLKAGEDRAAMACHLTIDKGGRVTAWRFTRALIRVAANIPYERAQAMIDGDTSALRRQGPSDGVSDASGPRLRGGDAVFRGGDEVFRGGDVVHSALTNLWACWHLLAKARDARNPLALDLPERRVVLDDAGNIVEVKVRERLDAHRLIEDYMIAANVAAAKALEAKKSPVMYRIHEPPGREKLVSLRDYLDSFGQALALGQVITPALFNRIIASFADDDRLPEVMEAILRTQTQAYYGPANAGHFGLALGSYAHFTSPIRRYADLIVHRALVDAHGLEMPGPRPRGLPPRTGLGDTDKKALERLGQTISEFERRAMQAERETLDRYVAAYLANKVGEVVAARITGVQAFGFFATVDGLGGDGLVPVSTLGAERFFYDESARSLESESGGARYTVGQRLELRLAEANPVSGALRFELPEGSVPLRGDRAVGRRRNGAGKHSPGKRGRPGNIRHQGKRR